MTRSNPRRASFARIAPTALAAAVALSFSTSALAADTAPSAEPRIDSGVVSGLGIRNIGSATMSGRVSSIAAVRRKDGALTIYVGAASGGVWKSTDGGATFVNNYIASNFDYITRIAGMVLVGGAMDRCRAQDTHIVGLSQEAHQVVNEPVCRRAPRLPIFHGNDHIEASAWIGDPAFLLESSQSCLQRDIRTLIGGHRFGLGERIAPSGLEGFNKGGH